MLIDKLQERTNLLILKHTFSKAPITNAILLSYLNTNYSFGGRKFEHALKHGLKNGLFVVTLGWFVDSVRRNGMC